MTWEYFLIGYGGLNVLFVAFRVIVGWIFTPIEVTK
jgi:hypothetical protein